MSGTVYKRCTKCGNRVKERTCGKCGLTGRFNWAFRAYVGKDADGRWIRQLRSGFPSRKDAERALRELISAVEDGGFVATSTMSLAVFLRDEWLPATAPPRVKYETWSDRKRNLEDHVIPRLGGVALGDLNAAHFNRLYADLLRDGRIHQPGGLSPTSVRRIHAMIRKALRFDPDPLPGDGDNLGVSIAATAEAFLTAADAARLLDISTSPVGEELDELRREFAMKRPPLPIKFTFDPSPPAIVHARLVERFGRTEDEAVALQAARRADLLRFPQAMRAHAHWAISASLYREEGLVGRAVGTAARLPVALKLLPARLANPIYDKGPAVLLPTGDYRAMHDLARQALTRPHREMPLRRGSDLYYLAHSLRYLNEPEQARQTLLSAASLLVHRRGTSDAERYAGVLLEEGMIAIHQARVGAAFAAAEALVYGPGRYAVGRWSGWGHWLWAAAHMYSVGVAAKSSDIDAAVNAACEHFKDAENDFNDSDLDRGQTDVFILRLLAHDCGSPPATTTSHPATCRG